jgi:Transposase DDE domain
MERELWLLLYHTALSCDKLTKARYRSAVIVGVYAWAVVHDRPVSWACDRRNWPETLLLERCFCLPSQSTMSRRLRSPDVECLLEQMSWLLTEAWTVCWTKIVDAKPLPIGGFSKDGDARWGRSVKGFAKGYKFYAIWGAGPMPLVWGLASMNFSELAMAKHMVPLLEGGGYLLGDSLYDSNPLYNLAGQHGHQLVAPRKQPGRGVGHRSQSPHRLRALELLETPFGKALHRHRDHIERNLGWLTSCAGGLQPLPAWVRRFHRVRLWLHMKLILNGLRRAPQTMQAVA